MGKLTVLLIRAEGLEKVIDGEGRSASRSNGDLWWRADSRPWSERNESGKGPAVEEQVGRVLGG